MLLCQRFVISLEWQGSSVHLTSDFQPNKPLHESDSIKSKPMFFSAGLILNFDSLLYFAS